MTKSKPRANAKPAPVKVDLSFATAAILAVPQDLEVRLLLVGCGGTGSWLAPTVARLVRVMRESQRKITAAFIDPDIIEIQNIGRQNFCDAELGLNKAVCLATRFNAAWGLDISAIDSRYVQDLGMYEPSKLTVLIGCVDNAAARQSLHGSLRAGSKTTWWLDGGNSESSGTILLGNAFDQKSLRGAFIQPKICVSLPSPALVAPDLLKARPEELLSSRMSCAELQMANMQSLMINQRVAAEMAEILYRMIMGGGLKRFGVNFDMSAGVARSLYITPEGIANAIKKPLDKLELMAEAKRR